MTGFVYFIQAGKRGPVKIGWAKNNIKARLDSFQTGNPETLAIIASLAASKRSLEKKIHRALSRHRMRGEWFRWAYPIDEMVARIAAGELDEHSAVGWVMAQHERLATIEAEDNHQQLVRAYKRLLADPETPDDRRDKIVADLTKWGELDEVGDGVEHRRAKVRRLRSAA